MNPEHQKKVEELADNFAASLKTEAQRLLLTGGITEENFSPDEYALAKILISAAILRRQDDYMPLDKDYLRTTKILAMM